MENIESVIERLESDNIYAMKGFSFSRREDAECVRNYIARLKIKADAWDSMNAGMPVPMVTAQAYDGLVKYAMKEIEWLEYVKPQIRNNKPLTLGIEQSIKAAKQALTAAGES